jgi:glyoxylase-like metal-dependent hydrolase (beta-lactamase superfamily II)
MSAQGYTGDVQVGGPADVRELPGLTISKLAVSEMANNAYLLRCTATGEALLIDAAAEPAALRELVGDAVLRTVVTTHGHWDHHRALAEVVIATGAETVAHPADAADLPCPWTGRSSTATR